MRTYYDKMGLFKFLGAVILLALIVLLGFSLFLTYDIYQETVSFESYSAELDSVPALSTQFYPNMRYRDRSISYYVENACSSAKREDAVEAFSILADKTILSFYESSIEPEIRILCSDIAPEPEQEEYFVAGEGGPTKILNNTISSVILEGKVSLYRTDECKSPQIAIHEILHALGFDHNNNEGSILFPITGCDQKIDLYIIEEINRIYSVESLPDLLIEEVSANKTGRYLNFDMIVANLGYKDADDIVLEISSDGKKIREFNLESINIATRKSLNVRNLMIERDADKIMFVVGYGNNEISKTNNRVEMSIA